MTNKRKIVDAKADSKGNISAVKLEGNSNWTSISKAKVMTKNNVVDAVYVNPSKSSDYIRQRPDKSKSNNLDDLAGL
jgi:hypothetical protein